MARVAAPMPTRIANKRIPFPPEVVCLSNLKMSTQPSSLAAIAHSAICTDGRPSTDPSERRNRSEPDRKSVVEGKSVSVSVDLGGRRIIKKNNSEKKKRTKTQSNINPRHNT